MSDRSTSFVNKPKRVSNPRISVLFGYSCYLRSCFSSPLLAHHKLMSYIDVNRLMSFRLQLPFLPFFFHGWFVTRGLCVSYGCPMTSLFFLILSCWLSTFKECWEEPLNYVLCEFSSYVHSFLSNHSVHHYVLTKSVFLVYEYEFPTHIAYKKRKIRTEFILTYSLLYRLMNHM